METAGKKTQVGSKKIDKKFTEGQKRLQNKQTLQRPDRNCQQDKFKTLFDVIFDQKDDS